MGVTPPSSWSCLDHRGSGLMRDTKAPYSDSLFTGIITSFPNEEHVSVLVDHAWSNWNWYVRNEAALLV